MGNCMMTQHASQLNTEEMIQINEQSDVVFAQHRSRLFAQSIGFTQKAQWQIAIAVSEAATNILKFAKHGTILIKELNSEPKGLEFVAEDSGPGIQEIEKALEDGFSEGKKLAEEIQICDHRGLGSGLPAIIRMMDYFIITKADHGGTILTARKFLPKEDEIEK